MEFLVGLKFLFGEFPIFLGELGTVDAKLESQTSVAFTIYDVRS